MDPPRIIADPNDLEDAVPGQEVMFTVHATGTEPLHYQWKWKAARKEERNEEWQQCDWKWCQGTTLRIPGPCVQKSIEGNYQCVIKNRAGRVTSKVAKLSIGKNPDIKYNCNKYSSCMFLPVSTYS